MKLKIFALILLVALTIQTKAQNEISKGASNSAEALPAEEASNKKSPSAKDFVPANTLKGSDLYLPPVQNLTEIATGQESEIKSQAQKDVSGPPPKVEIIVDSSGSMGQYLAEGKTKMFFLKKMMSKFMDNQWQEKASTGLRTYGANRKNDCDDNVLAIKFDEKNLDRIESTVKGFMPVGRTPLYQSVKDGSDDLKPYKGPKRMVVFTDGEETCGGDPCKMAEYIKENPELDLKIYVVAIDFVPGSESLKKISCLGDTTVANSEDELFNAIQKINDDIKKDRINLRVLSPDPQAQVQLFQKVGDEFKFFRSFTAGWGAEVPPGKYQAVVLMEPKFRFQEFEIPPKKVVTLVVKGPGDVTVKFFDELLNVEVLDKNMKVVRSFKSDVTSKVPNGRWRLRIFKDPFYESFVENYLVNPNGTYVYSVLGAGALSLESPKLKGYYVYDAKGKILGNHLPGFPVVLKVGEYKLFLDDNCYFEKVLVDEQKRIKEIRCLNAN